MHLGLPPFWGHISLEHTNRQKTEDSSLPSVWFRGSIQWFHVFPGETSLGWRMERWVLFCFRGALVREVCSRLGSGGLPCCSLLAGSVWSSRGRAHLTVSLWTAFFHPDNSLFIPDCSVLQTFVKFGGKWKIITLQVENDFNCRSDILVHRNLLSTFHHRELLIHLLPFCRSLLTANKVSTFPFRQPSTPLFWAYIFSYLICRAIPFFSLFLTFSFQTMTLEVLTFDSQYFDKVFSQIKSYYIWIPSYTKVATAGSYIKYWFFFNFHE